jgi:dCTP deaminase
MVLSKDDLLKRIRNSELEFSPSIDGFQLQPHAIDLRLGFKFQIPRTWKMTDKGRESLIIDPLFSNKEHNNFDEVVLKPGQYFDLLPEEYVISTTLEKISINSPDLMAVLYPRSSINRRGLAVDLSGIVDVGYSGYLMIPIVNNTQKQVIRIYPGERICQIVFQKLSSNVSHVDAQMHGLQKAKYNNNDIGFISGKSDKDEEIKLIKSGSLEELKQKYSIN